MYRLRRFNEQQGAGWSVEVTWIVDGREFVLQLYGVNFPRRQKTSFYFANRPRDMMRWHPRVVMYGGHLQLNGDLAYVDLLNSFASGPTHSRRLTPDVNILKVFTIAREVRRTNSVAEPLVDAFLELPLPEIQTLLDFKPTGELLMPESL